MNEHDGCCGTCRHYNGSYCTAFWNNMDEDYKTASDKKNPDDSCDEWEGELI